MSSMFVLAEWNELTLDRLGFGQRVLGGEGVLEEFVVLIEGILAECAGAFDVVIRDFE